MTDFLSIARDATDELRRQQCRQGPHEMVPREMLKCPRCGPVLRFDLAQAEAQIVQKPAQVKCTHEYGREFGRCMGCGEMVA